jgi:hypothetical protein
MARFTDLPPEMVSNVFAFVQQTGDQKRACLVNRSFRDLVAPILWEVWGSSLLTDDPHKLGMLVSHNSNVLANVKAFTLLRGPDGDKRINAQQQSLMTFVTALPRDKLVKFASNVELDKCTFRLVAQTQR